jgi:lysophospholipase L1-like esterase
MQRPCRLWFKLIAAFGGIVLALGVGEAAIRILESRAAAGRGVTVHPVAADSLQTPLGLRDRYDAIPQDAELTRIAFLGDSFTYGLGVQANQTFVHQVGLLLKKRWRGWCVPVNLGRPGMDLITAYTVLDQVKDQVRPQVVVHVMSQDDLDVDLYQEGEAIRRLVSERLWPSKYSRLFNSIETAMRWSQAAPRIENELRGGATPQQRERAWRIASFQIRSIKRLAESSGAIYSLVRFPCLRWVNRTRDYPLTETNEETARLAARLGVPYLDLLAAFLGGDPNELCLTSSDDHPTPKGHAIAAEAIADFLVKEVLPKVRSGPTSAPTTQRTSAAVLADEIRQYREVLEIDPTCASARFWLARAMKEAGKQ